MTLEVQRQNAKHNHNFMSRAKGKNSVLYSSLRASAERGLLPLCHGSYFDAVASLEVVRWGDKLQALVYDILTSTPESDARSVVGRVNEYNL